MRLADPLRKSILALAFSALAVATSASAAGLQTYQFASNEPRLLSFSGGILGYSVSAQLSGTFDVEVQNNGTATLTRFDVMMSDVLSEGITDPGWSNGQPLAPVLFVNPVGLTGIQDSTTTLRSSQAYPPSILTSGLSTTVTLTSVGGVWGRFNIESYPATSLDGPSFHMIAPTNVLNPGFLVQLVPEPSAFSIAVLGVMMAALALRPPAWTRTTRN